MAFPLIAAALGLAEFAPLIARWLGGENAENVAHHVVETAKKVTGSEDPVTAAKALSENSLLIAEFQKEIIKIEAELELQFLQDRKNARERDIALIQAGRRNVRADIMVLSAAAGLITCLYTLAGYAGTLPGEAVGIISTVAGIFGSCLKDAYTFEFGSSRGSREKDSMVAIMSQGQSQRF
jgi:hypothetical protein